MLSIRLVLLHLCAHAFSLNCHPIVLYSREDDGYRLLMSQQANNESLNATNIDFKIKLFQSCLINSQCPENAYCGLFEELDSKICVCKDGLMPDMVDNSTCIVMHKCSLQNFNAEYEQADCPQETQFCQNGVCKCKAGYSYSQEKCVWDRPDLDIREKTKIIKFQKLYPNIDSEKIHQTTRTNVWPWVKWIGICAVIMAILVFLVMATFLVLSFCKLMTLQDCPESVRQKCETQPLQQQNF